MARVCLLSNGVMKIATPYGCKLESPRGHKLYIRSVFASCKAKMKSLQLVVVAAFIFQTGASQCEGEQKYSMGTVIIEDKPLRVLYVYTSPEVYCNSMISVTKRTKICLWSHGEKHNEMVMVTTPILVIKLSKAAYL